MRNLSHSSLSRGGFPSALALTLALGLSLTLASPPARPGQQDRPKPPPLSLEGLRDEHLPAAAPPQQAPLKDNGPCFVCHENYRTEPLVQHHAREQIGCIDCHGPSENHRNDEDNITPPDRMIPLSDIDAMCRECHPDHLAPARTVLARWQQRCPDKTDPRLVVCTDCHFDHRLARRVVRWNKKTGLRILGEDLP